MKIKFGDVIINHYASLGNPHRIGIVVKKSKYLLCTNGKGDYWNVELDKEARLSCIGNVFNLEAYEELKNDLSK